MSGKAGDRTGGPRCIALLGPQGSGKTTLLEAILHRAGAISRMGDPRQGSALGDASPIARDYAGGVEPNVATCEFMGDSYTFIDCPGAVEFAGQCATVLPGVDAAVVVVEPDAERAPALQIILRQLDELNIPRLLFINKIDAAQGGVRQLLEVFQPVSGQPLVLRQIPIWKDGIAIGTIDLALERAHIYREHAQAEVVQIPADEEQREKEARFEMMEKLADYDDELLETLLSDLEPPTERVFEDLRREMLEGLITPVLLGAARNGNGILRLLKSLRHDVAGVRATCARLGIDPRRDDATGYVMLSSHMPQGRMALARLFTGVLKEGDTIHVSTGESVRVGGLFTLSGQQARKLSGGLGPGDGAAFARIEEMKPGATFATDARALPEITAPQPPQPVYGLALGVPDSKDEVKLSDALGRLCDEDPSLRVEHAADTGELVLWGQGEMHLRVALDKLERKFGVAVHSRPRSIAFKETIRKPARARGRHKKQTGGHGQYGDVILEISPLPRGEGFRFSETIHGGVVPRQYIPAVEAGIVEYNRCGPLGFPVVDIAVNLADGSHHSVDSSELAFKLAARLAMSEAMKEARPVLLEPIVRVSVHTPQAATSRVVQIITSHRGQILGFEPRARWPGWDTVEALMPEMEIATLINELRSATAGVGSFDWRFDHLQEVSGRLAEDIVRRHGASSAAAA